MLNHKSLCSLKIILLTFCCWSTWNSSQIWKCCVHYYTNNVTLHFANFNIFPAFHIVVTKSIPSLIEYLKLYTFSVGSNSPKQIVCTYHCEQGMLLNHRLTSLDFSHVYLILLMHKREIKNKINNLNQWLGGEII